MAAARIARTVTGSGTLGSVGVSGASERLYEPRLSVLGQRTGQAALDRAGEVDPSALGLPQRVEIQASERKVSQRDSAIPRMLRKELLE